MIEDIHDYWIDLENRHMWIHGIDMNTDSYDGTEPGVEYMMATRVIKNLYLLSLGEKGGDPVTIHLHTCGGIYEEGIAIYDYIKAMPYSTTILCHTHARSMSSLIFLAGDYRIMMPNTYFLFHRGSIEVAGEMNQVKHIMKWSEKQTDDMVEIYVNAAQANGSLFENRHNSYIRQKIINRMNEESDVFMTPYEAIQWGFADAVHEI